jgi:REP element-mobilizing transposase RayT
MPNHIHVIVHCLEEYTPGDVVREYKKATSNLIIRHIEAEGNDLVLALFDEGAKQPQKQRYAVWESKYQAKNIFTPEFLSQKTRIHSSESSTTSLEVG